MINKIVKYSSPHCGPCKQLSLVLNSMNLDYEEIDATKDPAKTAELGIKQVPTLIFYKNDKEIKRLIGMQSKAALESVIKSF